MVIAVVVISAEIAIKMNGTVKWYDATKGYGFIESEDNKDYFVHRSGVKDSLFSLETGQSVTFEITDSDKGPVAFNVEVQ